MKKFLALLLAAMTLLAMFPAAVAETAAEPVYGGDLTVLGFDFNTFFLPWSTTTSDRFNAAPAIESLGRRNQETGDTEGWLVKEFITDPDALTLTLKLQEGVKFSDGSDFNAEAVIWNFDKMVEFGKQSDLVNPVSYTALASTLCRSSMKPGPTPGRIPLAKSAFTAPPPSRPTDRTGLLSTPWVPVPS